jgi:hypothetical protein
MSVLNLGLQGVALAREEMVDEYENEFKKCNGMNAVRNVAKDYVKTAPTVATEPEVATQQVGVSIAAVDVPHGVEGEDAEPQRRPSTNNEVENNAVPCEVDEEPVVETCEKGTEQILQSDENAEQAQRYPTIAKEDSVARDDPVVARMSQLDQDDDEWLVSGADDKDLREVVAEKNVVEMGNNEPPTVDDPAVVRMSLLDQEEEDWLRSDSDEEVMRKAVTEVNESTMLQSDTIDLTDDADNPFIDAYFKSIEKARDTIAGQWRECNWDKKGLDIQDPATSDEVLIALPTNTFVYTI